MTNIKRAKVAATSLLLAASGLALAAVAATGHASALRADSTWGSANVTTVNLADSTWGFTNAPINTGTETAVNSMRVQDSTWG